MPLKNYKLLKGRVLDYTLDDDSSPHIEIFIEENGRKHRAAVNVRSKIAPHALLYARRKMTDSDKMGSLSALVDGVGDVAELLRLDYPSGLIELSEMMPAPFRKEGPGNDLLDYILPLLDRAMVESGARIYTWGETWDEPNKRDKYFGFAHGRGIHDIHMNQGSSGGFRRTNGRNQDGAMALQFEDGTFIEILLAFQSQSWNNDEEGHPLSTRPPFEPVVREGTFLRIIAALINADGEEEGNESVTLINLSDQAVHLQNWKIVDKDERVDTIGNQVVDSGGTLRLFLHTARLSNRGGTIELRAADDTVVHNVAYSKRDAKLEGWSVLF